jgi:GTP-binding protein YchF
MNISLGIVGMPNVGKSTLFNALTNNAIPAENYPFCTIDPNVGIVPVVDARLDKLAEIEKSAKKTPAVVEFWDIAGLVKGAAQGEGLGNQFLANIRSVSAIVHVVRAFSNDNILHVENSVDPLRDIDLIHTELILKDLETLEKRLKDLNNRARVSPKLMPMYEYFVAMQKHMSDNTQLANTFDWSNDHETDQERRELFLLTDKPFLFLVNVTEKEEAAALEKVRAVLPKNAQVMAMDIKLESEIAALPVEEQGEYLQELGLAEPALARLSREAYKLLGLISFFTAGDTEARAWTIQQGTLAPQAAGTIHTDFEKKFITAEVVKYDDFVAVGGWAAAKPQGKIKLAGKDYAFQDGDVTVFRHG